MEITLLATSRVVAVTTIKIRNPKQQLNQVLFLTNCPLVSVALTLIFTVPNSCQWLLLKLGIMVTLFLHFLHKYRIAELILGIMRKVDDKEIFMMYA